MAKQNKWIDNLLDRCIGFIEWIQHKRIYRKLKKDGQKIKRRNKALNKRLTKQKSCYSTTAIRLKEIGRISIIKASLIRLS